jgi:UDP-N-acetylmuramate dehydrogenase
MTDVAELAGLRGQLIRDEPMSRHVSWRAGGKASRCYRPADDEDLSAFLRGVPESEEIVFIGLGSNLLVRDGGFSGTVVLMHQTNARLHVRDGLLVAHAGIAAPKVARFAAINAFEGGEFLAGIPGSIGGALAMNAGCYGSETWDIVDSVSTIDRWGTIRHRKREEFAVEYRKCSLLVGEAIGKDEWFIGGEFALRAGSVEAARRKIRELLAKRVRSQPLSLPNAGSVFRNPPGDHAARLIERCGLKGLVRGGAMISEKHANFIVNASRCAAAADIEWLIDVVRARVAETTGVLLEQEVRIVGTSA